MSDLPLLDLATSTPAALCAAVQEAGCLLLLDSAVPTARWAQALADAAAFFALPQAAKDQARKSKYRPPLDAYAQFIYRGSDLLGEGGFLGAITSKTFMSHAEFEPVRRVLLEGATALTELVDIGFGVLDAAVEVALIVAQSRSIHMTSPVFIRLVDAGDRAASLLAECATSGSGEIVFVRSRNSFLQQGGIPLSYWVSDAAADAMARASILGDEVDLCWGLFPADDGRLCSICW